MSEQGKVACRECGLIVDASDRKYCPDCRARGYSRNILMSLKELNESIMRNEAWGFLDYADKVRSVRDKLAKAQP
ncbi:MAG: hypothetical protein ABFD92_21035 [Planctomycetaceae bacterium]